MYGGTTFLSRLPRPMQIKDVIHPVTQDADTGTGARIRPWVVRIPALNEDVVVGEVTHIHARPRARKAVPRLTGVLKRLVDNLKKLPLAGVHSLDLERLHAKEGVVEEPRVFAEKKAALGGHGARAVRVGVVEA